MNRIKRLIERARHKLSELDQQRALIDKDREKLIFAIQLLEADLAQGTPRRRGRPKNGRSVADLAEKILESRPDGLSSPSLLAQLKTEGYEPDSKDPINTLNAHLHGEKARFRRLANGCWMLTKYPEPRLAVSVRQDLDVAEFPRFLMKILEESQQGMTGQELGTEALKRGWNFQGKTPAVSVHFGLLNAAKRKLVENRDGRWHLIRQVSSGDERPSSDNGQNLFGKTLAAEEGKVGAGLTAALRAKTAE